MDPISIGGWQKAMPETILFLQSEINYTHIHFTNGDVLKVAYTLKRLEKRFVDLPHFYRVNRSYLVNMKFMTAYDSEKAELTMQNGHQISVARRRRLKFRKTFKLK